MRRLVITRTNVGSNVNKLLEDRIKDLSVNTPISVIDLILIRGGSEGETTFIGGEEIPIPCHNERPVKRVHLGPSNILGEETGSTTRLGSRKPVIMENSKSQTSRHRQESSIPEESCQGWGQRR